MFNQDPSNHCLMRLPDHPRGNFRCIVGWKNHVASVWASSRAAGACRSLSLSFHITGPDRLMSELLDKLLEFSEAQLIMGGDLNVHLMSKEDTSIGSSSALPGVRKQISQSIHGARLVDTWRLSSQGKGLFLHLFIAEGILSY